MTKEGFDPRQYLIKLQGGRDYLPVAARLQWLRHQHPDWGIKTRPIEINIERDYAIYFAEVSNETGRLISTGTKMETKSGFVDYLEKAETGAIGRALAVAGFGTQFTDDLEEGDRIVDSPRRGPGDQAEDQSVAISNRILNWLKTGPTHLVSQAKAWAQGQGWTWKVKDLSLEQLIAYDDHIAALASDKPQEIAAAQKPESPYEQSEADALRLARIKLSSRIKKLDKRDVTLLRGHIQRDLGITPDANVLKTLDVFQVGQINDMIDVYFSSNEAEQDPFEEARPS
jgi:hypothetical protein